MGVQIFAGDRVSAAQLTNIANIGEEVLDVTADTDSAGWNSTTPVLTNLFGTFAAIAGHKYKAEVFASVTGTSAIGYLTINIVMKEGGAAVATDTKLDAARTTRVGEIGGIYNMSCCGRFTAGTTTTIGLAVIGYRKVAGTTTNGNLHGLADQSVNRLHVTRIG